MKNNNLKNKAFIIFVFIVDRKYMYENYIFLFFYLLKGVRLLIFFCVFHFLNKHISLYKSLSNQLV